MVARFASSDQKPGDDSLWASASKLIRYWITKVLHSGPTPQHIAFIMDGNRRFATNLNKSITSGHEYGYLKVRRVPLPDPLDFTQCLVSLSQEQRLGDWGYESPLCRQSCAHNQHSRGMCAGDLRMCCSRG